MAWIRSLVLTKFTSEEPRFSLFIQFDAQMRDSLLYLQHRVSTHFLDWKLLPAACSSVWSLLLFNFRATQLVTHCGSVASMNFFAPFVIFFLILTFVSSTSSHYPNGLPRIPTVQARNELPDQRNASTDAPAENAAWVTCNTPPRYRLQVTVRDCAIPYHRYAGEPNFERHRPWAALAAPMTLSLEGEVCVIQLENYDRRRVDVFSIFDMFVAAFKVVGQCNQGYGGAASVGSKHFFVSVAGAIPGAGPLAQKHNVTLSLP